MHSGPRAPARTRPPVPGFSPAAIARFKGPMPFLAIAFFDMHAFAMSAFSAMALAAVSTLAMSMLVSLGDRE